jgi:hypothetical protein
MDYTVRQWVKQEDLFFVQLHPACVRYKIDIHLGIFRDINPTSRLGLPRSKPALGLSDSLLPSHNRTVGSYQSD